MPDFAVTGKGRDTGRRRKRIYSAESEAAARQIAEDEGTLVEEVAEIPPEGPTDRQIDYARDLGISIPPNATKEELSDLISVKVERDRPATERHKAFGRMYGVRFTDYVGKKALFGRIQSELIVPGRERELLSWFTFRVYRELAGGADKTPITNPNDSTILGIADELATDDQVLKSVRRYDGSELIWFGEWTSPDGTIHTGGSNRTAAYRRVSSLLKDRARFPEKATAKISRSATQHSKRSNVKGEENACLSHRINDFVDREDSMTPQVCKKCGYTRQPSDSAPDYECPKCGAIYAKVEAHLKKRGEEIVRENKKQEEQGRKKAAFNAGIAEARRQVQLGRLSICTECGYLGKPKRMTKGSIFIEIVLWLAFLIPGLIYSIWRLTTKYDACRECGHEGMIPVKSPRGRKLMAQFHPDHPLT